MKQFLKYVLATVTGIILVLIIVGILGGISLVGLAAKSASTTQVEENSVYTLKLSGITLDGESPNDLMLVVDYCVWEYQNRDKPGNMPEWLRLHRRERWLRLREGEGDQNDP